MQHHGTRHYANLLILMGLMVAVPGAWLVSGSVAAQVAVAKRISIVSVENEGESTDQAYSFETDNSFNSTQAGRFALAWFDAETGADAASPQVSKHQRKILRSNPPNGPPCFASAC